jgi:hypothetical protein
MATHASVIPDLMRAGDLMVNHGNSGSANMLSLGGT